MNKVTMFRNGGAVKRYHTLRTIGEQTVAEHSFQVACLLTAIVPDVSAELLKAALYHDLPEQSTGDIPATVKWRNPTIKKELCREETDFSFEHHTEVSLSKEDMLALKWADTLELIHYCFEQMDMGNAKMARVARRGVDFLVSMENYNGITANMLEAAIEKLETFTRGIAE